MAHILNTKDPAIYKPYRPKYYWVPTYMQAQ